MKSVCATSKIRKSFFKLLKTKLMTVYVISGPPASGKSSVSQRVAQKTNPCALISGDLVHHMIFFRNPPWVDKGQFELTWRNIACLVRNFVTSGYNVILDYVCYPHEAKWL
ncbi:hypothetical protein B9Q13_06210 [Candidatus Marsarchaeota G2 archaeon ECH_B_SAG-G16]|uniref:Zeta toxin domain-containing protein n=5 Tax=Candidatus Marsarchaeota TaxID=1978152 RepID=A0A2R6A8K8_9ARCH|nr:MAG: hypothetical protein B9Q02_11305 [Candidatus Marsarchaeota G1 archaeon BE_D]PSN83234.1 MAG: hypothetical protein B9Q01_05400 [Candidatus Marsarchaeota G1 archaeon OSP_D]PSN87252.1 MAG: hypothetical protein B9P99_06710 [Candidatus Marsarchaeota G1 archaeon OSP_B]PSN88308.1 MAG: hypothetical protein B9Q00_05920 [Candidatus Marsarchaeota G1 archaeon OSP_C]PSO03849.1 MAG: hypothetical protein B9Q13_06210 [Candidatus Marsarchaeota G2 archaeon ECH_B_SAG-G16]